MGGWACKEMVMDWDDVRLPAAGEQIIVGAALERCSVADLESRIEALEAEIERVRTALQRKRDHEARAASIFKS